MHFPYFLPLSFFYTAFPSNPNNPGGWELPLNSVFKQFSKRNTKIIDNYITLTRYKATNI